MFLRETRPQARPEALLIGLKSYFLLAELTVGSLSRAGKFCEAGIRCGSVQPLNFWSEGAGWLCTLWPHEAFR